MIGLLLGSIMLAVVFAGTFAFAILWSLFAAARFLVHLLFGVILWPLVLVTLVVAFLVAGVGIFVALLVPVVPIALLVAAIWLIVRLGSRRPQATAA